MPNTIVFLTSIPKFTGLPVYVQILVSNLAMINIIDAEHVCSLRQRIRASSSPIDDALKAITLQAAPPVLVQLWWDIDVRFRIFNVDVVPVIVRSEHGTDVTRLDIDPVWESNLRAVIVLPRVL